MAIRAFNTNRREKWIWLGVFIVLGASAVFFGIAQQVRMSAAQTRTDQAAREREARLIESQRYTQGQLDSINKVLVAAINSGGGSEAFQTTLKALLNATPKRVSSAPVENKDPPLSSLSNKELRYRTLEAVGRIHDIENKSGRQIASQKPEEIGQGYEIAREGWVPLHGECLALRDELVTRLPASVTKLKSPDDQVVDAALTEGRVYGLSLEYTATYLEKLANALPNSGAGEPGK